MSQKGKVLLSSAWYCVGFVLAILALQALVLHLMGRLAICSCGYVKLWEGDPAGPETSQHLTDWYTFSHLLHRFWLYFFLWLIFRHLPVSARLVLAVLQEAGWEILENTPFIIQRYPADTISIAYYGDTIVNSVSDTLTAVVGFLFAAWVPPTATILVAVAIEVGLAVATISLSTSSCLFIRYLGSKHGRRRAKRTDYLICNGAKLIRPSSFNSAFSGEAQIGRTGGRCPLMTRSGHRAPHFAMTHTAAPIASQLSLPARRREALRAAFARRVFDLSQQLMSAASFILSPLARATVPDSWIIRMVFDVLMSAPAAGSSTVQGQKRRRLISLIYNCGRHCACF